MLPKIGDLFYTAGNAQIHMFLGIKDKHYHFYGPLWNHSDNFDCEYNVDNCDFWKSDDKKWVNRNFYETCWKVIKCP